MAFRNVYDFSHLILCQTLVSKLLYILPKISFGYANVRTIDNKVFAWGIDLKREVFACVYNQKK
jgi:hypothetical protein